MLVWNGTYLWDWFGDKNTACQRQDCCKKNVAYDGMEYIFGVGLETKIGEDSSQNKQTVSCKRQTGRIVAK